MRWWYLPLGLLGLAIIAIVVGVVLLSIQDVGHYKEFIARKVSEKTGRELVIAGDLDLSISLNPSIVADDVTFENAEWGSRPEMLKLGHVEAEVELFPMLMGDIRIKRLILEDLDILAETNEQGLGNWDFNEKKAAETRTPKTTMTNKIAASRWSRICASKMRFCASRTARPGSAMW